MIQHHFHFFQIWGCVVSSLLILTVVKNDWANFTLSGEPLGLALGPSTNYVTCDLSNTVKTPYKRTPGKRKLPIREENGATKFFM